MGRSGTSAWYAEPITKFLSSPSVQVHRELIGASTFDVTVAQRDAWLQEIEILHSALVGVDGWVVLEFEIPRLGSRVDAVVVSSRALIPIEFKVGEGAYTTANLNQAWDYALDLKNFHAASHDSRVFPILVATGAPAADVAWKPPHLDGVCPPRRANAGGLATAIREALANASGPALDGATWVAAPYHPTPTIVEAARALYAGHAVDAISRSDAGARNLTVTSGTVETIIESAARDKYKAIVFVTGVPGAGKTLVGLNVATRRRSERDAAHAVFLSGNGPLVAVLREALTRDAVARNKANGQVTRRGDVAQPVKQFIQNVHHFRDDGVRTLETREVPHDRVVIFDEAQRAWDLAKTVDFMKRQKKQPGFTRSEPQFLIEYMDRHPDWAVIICLVGGGQEINRGEAGITTWLDAVREHFPAWHAYISPELFDSEYAAGHALEKLSGVACVERRPELHLATSMRAFRSEKVSAFVKALLDLESTRAQELLRDVVGRYPIRLSRDLNAAKQWIRSSARGTERFGLVASSQALRLKPHAVDIRVDIDPVHWFLNDADDVRSSYYLEDAATEYQIQGLELDWVCVAWDADLRFDGAQWQYGSFNAKGWQKIRASERQRYLTNAYRVLLTRARQGMVIFVPPGDRGDPTRTPEFYDSTYDYLRSIGIPSVDA